ncbi:MAG: methyl-accepting chemotaxis protein [Acidaminobacteraceae bacterium]
MLNVLSVKEKKWYKYIKNLRLNINYKDVSVTTKILSMSLILIICILLTLINYKSLLKDVSTDDINLLKSSDDLTLNIHKMNYYLVSFLETDATNLDFYASGESENIEKFKISYDRSIMLLENIKGNNSYLKLKSDDMTINIEQIEENLLLVDSNFTNMNKLTRTKGFSSIGKVSELASAMNVLEGQLNAYLDADFLNYLLSQKKYESIYLINEDRTIATKLLINSSSIIDIARQKLYPDEVVLKIESNVNKYNDVLSSLQKTNISINNLKNDNAKLSDTLSLSISQLQEEINIKTNEKILRNTRYVDLITFSIVFFSVIFSVFISTYISKPIKELNERLKDISEGDGDLTRRLDVNNNSELGIMAKLFNLVLISITSLVSKVKLNTSELSTSTNQISVAMNKASLAISEISIEIGQISSGIQIDVGLINETLNNVCELSTSAKQISLKSTDAVDETEDILNSSKLGTEKLTDVLYEIENVQNTSLKVNEILSDLSKSSSEINSINTVISKIADQTSMLSLNAAIEAARAGEYGRGFSVVASEIKILADESKKSIKNINNIVASTTKSIEEATKLMKDEMIQVKNVFTNANETKLYFDEILLLIVEINSNVKNISDLSKSQYSTSDEVNTSIKDLSKNLIKTAQSSKNISINIDEQTINTEDINRQVFNLRNLSSQLHDITLKYKV